MRILVLDDDENRHDYFARELALLGQEVVHTWTYDQCVDALTNQDRFDVVFLDHDLNDHGVKSVMVGGSLYGGIQELDGRDVAYYMAQRLDKDKRPGQVVVHSWNPDGAREMVQILRDDGYTNVVRWEFNPKQKLKLK